MSYQQSSTTLATGKGKGKGKGTISATTQLAHGACVFCARRLSRPDWANVLWIGSLVPPEQALAIRRLVRIGGQRPVPPNAVDILASLEALPFRNHQFQGIVLDTDQAKIADIKHAEQLYRVLSERAPLILVGQPRAIGECEAKFFGLFKPSQLFSRPGFIRQTQAKAEISNTMATTGADASAPLAQALSQSRTAIQGQFARLTNQAIVRVYEKVTPPPPLPGLFQPAAQRVNSAMPSTSLARGRETGLALKRKNPLDNLEKHGAHGRP